MNHVQEDLPRKSTDDQKSASPQPEVKGPSLPTHRLRRLSLINHLKSTKTMHSRFLAATSSFLLGFATQAAAQYTWTGNGTDDYWTTNANWLGGTPPPVSPVGETTVNFNGSSSAGPVLINDDWAIGRLYFQSGSPSLDVSTDNASTLSTWRGLDNSSSVNQTVSVPLLLNTSPFNENAEVFTSGTGSHLHVTGPVDVNGASLRLFGVNGSLSTINFSGNLSGDGRIYSAYGNTQAYFTGSNAFVGTLEAKQGTLSINGDNGSFAQAVDYVVGGYGLLQVGDAAATSSNPDRLSDSGTLQLSGLGQLFLTGTDNATPTSEVVGQIALDPGVGQIRLTPANSSRQVEMVASSAVDREQGALLIVGGQNLGAAPGADTTRLIFGSAPDLVGGGGGDGTTTIDIVPYVIASGNLTDETNTRGFTTYGANGLRPLDLTTEYLTNIAAATAIDNVNLGTNATLSAATDVNALRIASSRSLDLGGNTLGVESGALHINSNGVLSNGTIDFGNREGIITASSATISASISGNGGLTWAGISGTSSISGNNTYSGVTYLTGSLDLHTNSALGAVGSGNHTVISLPNNTLYLNNGISMAEDLVIQRGAAVSGYTPLYVRSGDNVFSGNLSVAGTDSFADLYIHAQSGSSLDMQGDIILEAGASSAQLNIRPQANSRVTISGQIQDDASSESFSLASNTVNPGTIEIQSANDYKGGTQISSGATLLISNSSGSATGRGSVSLNSSSVLAGSGFIDPSSGMHVYINNTAALAPGDPDVAGGIGTLTVGSSGSENDVWFSSGSSLFADVGATSDLLEIFGGLVTSGTGDIFVDISDADGATPGIYTLVDYSTSFTGNFSLLELNALPSGWSGSLVHNTVDKSIEFHLSAIPEPSTTALILIAGGAWFLQRRRTQARSSD